MKNIVIAAGYATRLYPLTENFPKPLLKVGGTSILGRLVEDVDHFPEIDEHIIVTNHKFAQHFAQWAGTKKTRRPIRIIDDGTSTNETRLGAVRDLLLAISRMEADDDILVMAADNILPFSLRGFLDAFAAKQTSMIMCHHEPSVKALQRTGVIRVDAEWRVLEMQEKPEVPCSNWAVPPFYIYARADLPLIRTCIENGCGSDAPGNLAHFLVDNSVMHAWQMPAARFDIGSLDSYQEAQRLFG